MKTKNIVFGLATVGLSIAIAPSAYAISLIKVVPQSDRLAISGNDLFAQNFNFPSSPGSIRKIDATTDAVINSNFANPISSTRPFAGLWASGNNLYSSFSTSNASGANGEIRKYDITTGAVSTFLSGLRGNTAIGIDGNYLYTTVAANGRADTPFNLAKYDLTTGAQIYSVTMPTNANSPAEGFAFSGNNIFVSRRSGSFATSVVATFNATTGGIINSALVSGLRTPSQLAIDGNSLFVTDPAVLGIKEYNATTGGLIANLVTTEQIVGVTLGGDTLYVSSRGSQGFSIPVASPSTSVPEPFTIIGTIVGGTAALRLRKKLKAESSDANAK